MLKHLNKKKYSTNKIKKLLMLVLVFTLTLTLSAFANVNATPYSAFLPNGVNYMEGNNISLDNYFVENNDPILIKANTDYTFAVHGDFAGPSGLSLPNGWGEEQLENLSFANGYYWLTFNSGSYTAFSFEMYYQEDEYFEDTSSSIDDDDMLFSLTEGTTFTGWVRYEAPINDTTPPLINGASGITHSNVNNPETTASILAGLTAVDGVEGDVTASLTVITDNLTGNTLVLGDHTLVITASDSSNNTTTITLIVRVVDSTDPIIDLIGDNEIYMEIGDTFVDPGVNVTDNFETGIEAEISGDTVIPSNVIQAYEICYDAEDSTGNQAAQVCRNVYYDDTTAPVQTLIGSSVITVQFGSNYTEQGATVSDIYDTGLSSTITGSVNVSVLGTYTVSYNVTDTHGNVAATLTRTVHVVDTVAPSVSGVLTYNKNSFFVTSLESIIQLTYSDLYTSNANLVVTYENDTYTGNEQVPGVYTVNIKVTDQNNNSTIKTVTINVIDDEAPIITTTLQIFSVEYANSMTQQQIKDLFN